MILLALSTMEPKAVGIPHRHHDLLNDRLRGQLIPLPNTFWKLQSWGCFNAGLVYCARAICQSMYQIAINMSRYKYKLSQFTHHITVLLMLWHFLRIKSPWNLLKLQSSKCKCNLKIDVTTRLEEKTFLATDSLPSYSFFKGHLIYEYMCTIN